MRSGGTPAGGRAVSRRKIDHVVAKLDAAIERRLLGVGASGLNGEGQRKGCNGGAHRHPKPERGRPDSAATIFVSSGGRPLSKIRAHPPAPRCGSSRGSSVERFTDSRVPVRATQVVCRRREQVSCRRRPARNALRLCRGVERQLARRVPWECPPQLIRAAQAAGFQRVSSRRT